MRFRLVYRGPLPASGNSSKKPKAAQEIRDQLHPQMEYLWRTHTALKRLRQTAVIPRHPLQTMLTTRAHPLMDDRDLAFFPVRTDEIDLCGPIDENGRSYIPLVRKSLDLNCQLNILFLRHEDPGSLVLQGGDLDNRIKTLFDALRKPEPDVADKFPPSHNPMYCLLESDTLISGFDVDTDRLLTPSQGEMNDVHLIIEVIVRVLKIGVWNMSLLGM